MKFGKVDDPSLIDFTLPEDHPDTVKVLGRSGNTNNPEVFVGCAKWNRTDLKGFYPRGTKDELSYYSSQFNCIELNATFYGNYDAYQIETWRDKTPSEFKFFPKVTQMISHMKRLNGVDTMVSEFCDNIAHFEEKLGVVFLQLHDNFSPKNFDRLQQFLNNFPKGIPLAVEVRNTAWLNDAEIAERYYGMLESLKVINIITDTAGRRDLLHMRLTTPKAFVRWVGANHPSDRQRLEDWFERFKSWQEQGLEALYFFVHQNVEKESPLLSAGFIEKLNNELGYNLTVPKTLQDITPKLFP